VKCRQVLERNGKGTALENRRAPSFVLLRFPVEVLLTAVSEVVILLTAVSEVLRVTESGCRLWQSGG
jgi:hypothetical protein